MHVAATYGHMEALEVMVSHGTNLFALDNNGRTAAKVAAVHQKAEPCRYLDTLAVRWEMENREYVEKMQTKAMKDLKRRAKRASEEKKEGKTGPTKKPLYDYSTAPSGIGTTLMSDAGQARSPSVSNLTRKKKLSTHEALRQNFELRASGSSHELGTAEEAGIMDNEHGSHSAGSTFRPTPNAGPLINTLQSLTRGPMRVDPTDELRRGSVESGFISQGRPGSSSASEVSLLPKATPHGSRELKELELVPSRGFVTENDSTLATFLQSLDLMECVQLLHKEKLDLDALALCEEQDLVGIGLPLGPRKKILHAIKRRKELLGNPGKLTDTDL